MRIRQIDLEEKHFQAQTKFPSEPPRRFILHFVASPQKPENIAKQAFW